MHAMDVVLHLITILGARASIMYRNLLSCWKINARADKKKSEKKVI